MALQMVCDRDGTVVQEEQATLPALSAAVGAGSTGLLEMHALGPAASGENAVDVRATFVLCAACVDTLALRVERDGAFSAFASVAAEICAYKSAGTVPEQDQAPAPPAFGVA